MLLILSARASSHLTSRRTAKEARTVRDGESCSQKAIGFIMWAMENKLDYPWLFGGIIAHHLLKWILSQLCVGKYTLSVFSLGY